MCSQSWQELPPPLFWLLGILPATSVCHPLLMPASSHYWHCSEGLPDMSCEGKGNNYFTSFLVKNHEPSLHAGIFEVCGLRCKLYQGAVEAFCCKCLCRGWQSWNILKELVWQNNAFELVVRGKTYKINHEVELMRGHYNCAMAEFFTTENRSFVSYLREATSAFPSLHAGILGRGDCHESGCQTHVQPSTSTWVKFPL